MKPIIKKPAITTRDFHGYRQYLEEWYFYKPDKIGYCWMFYVSGFSFCDNFANVERSDGTKQFVHIDRHNRILINGKRYGREYWNH